MPEHRLQPGQQLIVWDLISLSKPGATITACQRVEIGHGTITTAGTGPTGYTTGLAIRTPHGVEIIDDDGRHHWIRE